MIKSVNIIGYGNVGRFFSEHLSSQGLSITVYQRSGVELGAQFVSSFEQLPFADLTIVCVKDDVIGELSRSLNTEGVVVHTSGSVAMSVLSGHSKHGVLYPLQTISKERLVKAQEVPFLIEASSSDVQNLLSDFTKTYLSEKISICSSEKREKIHLAAVMVNNFVNHLIHQADNYLASEGQSIELLYPLIEETISKAIEKGAKNAQTGPAKRGDQAVISKHLELIEDDKMKELYQLFSELISKKFNA